MIVLLDNYDSFVYNLARYFERLGQSTRIVRSDQTCADEIASWAPQAIVLSPGPSTPENAGCCIDVVRRMVDCTPMLGVCLGHQAIAAALGGTVIRSTDPRHGRSSDVHHDASPLFTGIDSPLSACRYHSLIVEEYSLPQTLRVTARTSEGTVMALEHIERPVFGVQFHPEAILTSAGYRLLFNFLALAGMAPVGDPEELAAAELRLIADPRLAVPNRVVTF